MDVPWPNCCQPKILLWPVSTIKYNISLIVLILFQILKFTNLFLPTLSYLLSREGNQGWRKININKFFNDKFDRTNETRKKNLSQCFWYSKCPLCFLQTRGLQQFKIWDFPLCITISQKIFQFFKGI